MHAQGGVCWVQSHLSHVTSAYLCTQNEVDASKVLDPSIISGTHGSQIPRGIMQAVAADGSQESSQTQRNSQGGTLAFQPS